MPCFHGDDLAGEEQIFALLQQLPSTIVGGDAKILEGARDAGKAKGTVGQIRQLLVRFFNSLESDETIATNPTRLVKLPEGCKEDKRPRTSLTDAEWSMFLAAPIDDIEIKIIAFTARTMGGARTVETSRWDWGMVDREAFATCVLPRAKRGEGEIQHFDIPLVLQPFLRLWWQSQGCPSSGAVFPITRGLHKGQARGKTSHAKRFRTALTAAGVTRLELHTDTAWSRKTDFHTRRREFVSGLAKSGTNEQTSMALAHHADSKVHRKYQTEQIVAIPVLALPSINEATLLQSHTAVGDSIRRRDEKRLISSRRRGIRTPDFHRVNNTGSDESELLRALERSSVATHTALDHAGSHVSTTESHAMCDCGCGQSTAVVSSSEARAFRAVSWLAFRRKLAA